jgi:hypothetical protein
MSYSRRDDMTKRFSVPVIQDKGVMFFFTEIVMRDARHGYMAN